MFTTNRILLKLPKKKFGLKRYELTFKKVIIKLKLVWSEITQVLKHKLQPNTDNFHCQLKEHNWSKALQSWVHVIRRVGKELYQMSVIRFRDDLNHMYT